MVAFIEGGGNAGLSVAIRGEATSQRQSRPGLQPVMHIEVGRAAIRCATERSGRVFRHCRDEMCLQGLRAEEGDNDDEPDEQPGGTA